MDFYHESCLYIYDLLSMGGFSLKMGGNYPKILRFFFWKEPIYFGLLENTKIKVDASCRPPRRVEATRSVQAIRATRARRAGHEHLERLKPRGSAYN